MSETLCFCYTAADTRSHAKSRIRAALEENKSVDQAQAAKSAKDIEQHCFERAVTAGNARYVSQTASADHLPVLCDPKAG